MPFPATSLAHPSLSYRLTGALAEAASQRASGFSIGYSMLFNRHGRAIASIRAYGDNLFHIFSGNRSWNPKLALTPGFAARCRFAQSLGDAEGSAHIKHWS